MDLINQFIENYKKKINFYETAGRIAAEMLEVPALLGIRAMVTSRAKSPSRLKIKVTQRNEKRETPYKNMSEIYADIADLPAYACSLYFPGDRAKADRVINNLFTVAENQEIPGAVETAFLQQTFFRLLGYPLPGFHEGRFPG